MLLRMLLIGLYVLFSAAAFGQEVSGNWVKWHAKKTMFLFKRENPVGINKDIDAKLVKEGEMYKVSIAIPLDKFDSGEAERDTEVVAMLKGNVNKSLLFESKSYNTEELTTMLSGGSSNLVGRLRIGEDWHDLTFNAEIKDGVLTAESESTLSNFEVEPPSVLVGIVAKVDDYIKLSVRLNVKKLAEGVL